MNPVFGRLRGFAILNANSVTSKRPLIVTERVNEYEIGNLSQDPMQPLELAKAN
jgi:hypothetical protein